MTDEALLDMSARGSPSVDPRLLFCAPAVQTLDMTAPPEALPSRIAAAHTPALARRER